MTDAEPINASDFHSNALTPSFVCGLIARAHRNAVDKGFWETPPSLAMSRSLLHSEVSEALEDLRASCPLRHVYYPDARGESIPVSERVFYSLDESERPIGRKPCGIPSEIADVAIRALDFLGSRGLHNQPDVVAEYIYLLQAYVDVACRKIPATVQLFPADFSKIDSRVKPLSDTNSMVEVLDLMHSMINHVGRKDDGAWVVLALCGYFAEKAGFRLMVIVEEKMTYNAGRPVKHGGKKF